MGGGPKGAVGIMKPFQAAFLLPLRAEWWDDEGAI